jgi:electron-transferring-flavoprotein dehydrogenase
MGIAPAQFPPPVTSQEFVAADQLSPEQQIPVGVLFVGAGPANLAGAIRLAQLLETAPEIKSQLGDFPVAIIEKGKYPGAHLLSGAVINPSPFQRLFPALSLHDMPFAQAVPKESVYYLTRTRAFPIPVPPTMRNHGYRIGSLSRIGKWLGEQAEGMGVTILSETVGQQLLMRDGCCHGVRTGDKGRGRTGATLPNFEPGVDITAHWTVLGEGGTGHLTQTLLDHCGVTRPNPQIHALGVKEVWEVEQSLDRVVHTMGWPLRGGARFREFGGSFCYPVGPNKISLGLVVGLDYADASLSVHHLLQEMKTHPLFAKILQGGKRVDQGWGAKTIPEGGFYSLPTQLQVPGACLVGDAAGFVNVPALKGIHYAMWSGIYAAESIFAALRAGKTPQEGLASYDTAVRESFMHQELYAVRNMRQAFQGGLIKGAIMAGLMTLTGGRFPGGRLTTQSDAAHTLFDGKRRWPKADQSQTFDKLTSVHAAGTRSRDDQPNHLRVTTTVPEVVGEALIHMCPAEVYEWAPGSERTLQINPTNCVHCGAISAKGGRLTPQEGGSGPEYTEM